MSKKLILFSGGMDSLAIMIEYLNKYGSHHIQSLGVNYGQRHFEQENKAARRFCQKYSISRYILDIPLNQIGSSPLLDKTTPVTTNMDNQRSTVVPQRNAILLLFAAAYAEQNDCDTIVHGACIEDYKAYRDCRDIFFELLTNTIQAGRTQPKKGSEDILDDLNTYGELPEDKTDILIETPLINETKIETVKRIIGLYGVDVYVDSYTCYNGQELQCGVCPACQERIAAFKANGVTDPVKYAIDIEW